MASFRVLRGKSVWARTWAEELKSFASPRFLYRYRTRPANARIYREYRIPIQPIDLTVGIGDIEKGLGLAANFLERLRRTPGVTRLAVVPEITAKAFGEGIRNTYGRAARAFGTASEVARVELIKAMEKSWLRNGSSPEALGELASKMVGIRTARASGATAVQATLESAALFAPSFIRAWLSILRDIGRRGATGNEIRKSLGGFLFATTLSYIAISEALGQKPKLKPWPKKYGGDGAEAFTIEWGDTHIGLPLGFLYRVMRLTGDTIATVAMEPEKFYKIDLKRIRDYPILRTFFGSASPFVNLVADLGEEREFFGKNLEDPEDYAALLLDQVLPIWAQSLIETPAAERWREIGPQILGLRSFASTWERLEEMQLNAISEFQDLSKEEDKALQEGTLTWDTLGKNTQEKIEKAHPEIKALSEKLDIEMREFADIPQKLMNEFFDEQARADEDWNKELFTYQAEVYEMGVSPVSLWNFRLKYREANDDRWGVRESIQANPRFAPVLKRLDELKAKRDVEKTPQFNLAWYDYIDRLIANPNLEDKFHNFLYDKYEAELEAFTRDWGEKMVKEIKDYQEVRRGERPFLEERMLEAREITRPYWEVRERLLKYIPVAAKIDTRLENPVGLSPQQITQLERHPEYRRFQRALQDIHGIMREKNPELDAALYLWYGGGDPKTDSAVLAVEKLMEELEEGLPTP